jgi:hypothetical protein
VLSLYQEVADSLVGEYAKCRERSMVAWKGLGAGQREALIRYRISGHREINGLLRKEFGTEKATKKMNKKTKGDSCVGGGDVLEWDTIVEWSKPATHWKMSEGHSFGPTPADCPLYESPIGSLARLVVRVQEAIRTAVGDLDGVFASKGVPRLTSELVLFRGISGAEAEAFAACEVGGTVPQPGFLSTSLTPIVARDFMGKTTIGQLPCLLVLRAPAGMPFVFYDGITGGMYDISDEMEILFPRGASIRKLSKGRETNDPGIAWRTEALLGVKAARTAGPGKILVVDCDLVPPPASGPPPLPPPPRGAMNRMDSTTVKMVPALLAKARTTACRYSSSS